VPLKTETGVPNSSRIKWIKELPLCNSNVDIPGMYPALIDGNDSDTLETFYSNEMLMNRFYPKDYIAS